jgi:HlyD family secretion protein
VLKKILIGAAVVAVLAAVVVFSLRSGGSKKGTRVYVAKIERGDIVRVVKASGEIDPRIKVNISSPIIGKIEELWVEEGDEVAAGDPFLRLETEALTAVRDQASAQLAIARSRLRQAEISREDAQLKLQRMERLSNELIASAEQLEAATLQEVSARLTVEQSKETVSQAKAALDKTRDDLSKATIFAPISGRVVALSAEEGEVVVSGTMNNPASVIGTIADLSEILAEVDVDETEVAYLELDQPVKLEVDALPEREFLGQVVEIGSSGFQRPRQPDVTFFKVKILLEEPDLALRPGMSVRVEIETARNDNVLLAPIQAVVDRPPLEDEDKEKSDEEEEASEQKDTAATPDTDDESAAESEEIQVVFVIEDEKAHQRPVETGLSDATRAEIISGLEEGEEVVVGPYRSLKDLEDGDRVRPRSQDDGDDEGDED